MKNVWRSQAFISINSCIGLSKSEYHEHKYDDKKLHCKINTTDLFGHTRKNETQDPERALDPE